MTRDIKEVWKFPLECKIWETGSLENELDIYIRDSQNHIVMQWCRFDNPVNLCLAVIKKINGEELTDSETEMIHQYKWTSDGTYVYKNGERFIKMRSWGYLTGFGGLNMKSEDAVDMQTAMISHVRETLNS